MRIIFFPKKLVSTIIVSVLIFSIITGCSLNLNQFGQSTQTTTDATQEFEEIPYALVKFQVHIPLGTPEGNIAVEILDEVTGLGVNPLIFELDESGDKFYSIDVPIPLGSEVKYRYIRLSSPKASECSADGTPVRYRLMRINGHESVTDTVTAWSDYPYSGSQGRLIGYVINKASKSPIPNALILVGGQQTITAADGSFYVDGISAGLHTVVAYSMDGSFMTFHQGAIISESSVTQALIEVEIRPTVKVTFIAQLPEGSIKGLPVRLVGNIYQLGNTFSDLDGGMSVIAARAPLMTTLAEGIYSLTLDLPAGLDLRYKYTLGDGFWNAEHTSDGQMALRQLIVPDHDITLTDIIETWKSGESAPISFMVKVPDNTPLEDLVSIQFKTTGWNPAIPMWPLGNNQWLYILYSPFNIIANASYRYCRNDQCGWADAIDTQGPSSAGFQFASDPTFQTIEDVIDEWAWLPHSSEVDPVVAISVNPRENTFTTGVEVRAGYSPEQQPYYYWGMQKMNEMGVNLTILSPTWRLTNITPPIIEAVPGQDMMWFDIFQAIQTSRQNGSDVAIFPRINDSETLWGEPIYGETWWQNWYDRYQVFLLHFADLCEQADIPVLILGGKEILPMLPQGSLPDGNPSAVPDSAQAYWDALLEELGSHYTGMIGWYAGSSDIEKVPADWINQFDLVYVSVYEPLTENYDPDLLELTMSVENILDTRIYPLFEQNNKPIWIGIEYPSIDGANMGCPGASVSCPVLEDFSSYNDQSAQTTIDLQEQADIYQAFMEAINTRPWISGTIARGFNPIVAQQDPSTSINGKPAYDVLWYWYVRFRGQ